MIGDLGALVLRAILEKLVGVDAHQAAGAGHRGEFDVIISTRTELILGEIKASPLVAFPIACRLDDHYREHEWVNPSVEGQGWAMFIGAAESQHHLTLSPPITEDWPYKDILRYAGDPAVVSQLLEAWRRHLRGYRLFNEEAPSTRWHRFGCGNIESRDPDGSRVQLRVDNTKILPGIDRTDDLKKGLAQVMMSGRLKQGCRVGAIKNVLFGNVFAETHYKHYVSPIAKLKLLWPNSEPVWLFDAIIGLNNNIINDDALYRILGLPRMRDVESDFDEAALADELTSDSSE